MTAKTLGLAEHLEELVERAATRAAEKVAARNVDKEVERRVAERLQSEEMTIEDVCALLNCSRATVYRYRVDHGLPAPRKNPTGTVRFIRSEVEAWRQARPLSEVGAA